jgi:hypothetical protein
MDGSIDFMSFPLFLEFHILLLSIYLSVCLSVCSTAPFSFLIFYTVGRTPWKGNQPVARPLPTGRTTQQTQNKRIQTSMSKVGFEPTISVFERTKTVHALDRAATVIGHIVLLGHSNA